MEAVRFLLLFSLYSVRISFLMLLSDNFRGFCFSFSDLFLHLHKGLMTALLQHHV